MYSGFSLKKVSGCLRNGGCLTLRSGFYPVRGGGGGDRGEGGKLSPQNFLASPFKLPP